MVKEFDRSNGKMKCCNDKCVFDLTQGLGKHRHYFCHSCKSHLYKNKFYDYETWEKWINEEK